MRALPAGCPGHEPDRRRWNLLAEYENGSADAFGWLSDFEMSGWPDCARQAAYELGEFLAVSSLWVALLVPRTGAHGQPSGWQTVAYLGGPYLGYERYDEMAMDLKFGDSGVVLDFVALRG